MPLLRCCATSFPAPHNASVAAPGLGAPAPGSHGLSRILHGPQSARVAGEPEHGGCDWRGALRGNDLRHEGRLGPQNNSYFLNFASTQVQVRDKDSNALISAICGYFLCQVGGVEGICCTAGRATVLIVCPHTEPCLPSPRAGWEHVSERVSIPAIPLPSDQGVLRVGHDFCLCPQLARDLGALSATQLAHRPLPTWTQPGHETEMDGWLRKRFEGLIADTEIVQREDLDLVRMGVDWVADFVAWRSV